MMWHGINFLLIVKHIVAIVVLACIVLAPAYLAAINGRDKQQTYRIRCASWLFGWSIIGWIIALFMASKK